jgi:LPXTG-motif cell wall-anchored protein
MTTRTRTIVKLCMNTTFVGLLAFTAVAQQKMPQTTTERISGAPTTTNQNFTGKVLYVEGNTLVVKMSSGEVRTFNPPESRKFMIDGQELSVRDLTPGTMLHATITTTTTPVTTRTTTVGSGKVFFVSGNSVILTLPNNENRQYKVKPDYRFIVDGRKASVHELRKGMTVAAEKIVEEPTTEIAADTTVTGSAPKVEVAQARPPAREEPAPAPAAAPAPAPAPVEQAAALPAKLPKTGSPLPLFGVLGCLFVGASLGLRRLRRS